MKPQQPPSLKQVSQEKLQQPQLSSQQLDQLLTMQSQIESATPAKQTTPSLRKPWYRLLSASAIAAMLVLTLSLWLPTEPHNDELIYAIASEVAKNHIKMKPLEVQTQSFADLRSYFTQLDFAPSASKVFKTNNLNMLGARYCSIQGITAAQLRYRQINEQGEYQTLYQVPYQVEQFKQLKQLQLKQEPIVVYAQGLEIQMWVEKDLLMVATRELLP